MSFEVQIADSQSDRQHCYRLRHIVFVEEQDVPVELEIDEMDEANALHVLGRLNGEPVAAGRICIFGQTAKIQRVVVLKEARGQGLGKKLMEFLISHIRSNSMAQHIALDAQTYAEEFYASLGFVPEGDVFDDAGIPHIHMRQPI